MYQTCGYRRKHEVPTRLFGCSAKVPLCAAVVGAPALSVLPPPGAPEVATVAILREVERGVDPLEVDEAPRVQARVLREPLEHDVVDLREALRCYAGDPWRDDPGPTRGPLLLAAAPANPSSHATTPIEHLPTGRPTAQAPCAFKPCMPLPPTEDPNCALRLGGETTSTSTGELSVDVWAGVGLREGPQCPLPVTSADLPVYLLA